MLYPHPTDVSNAAWATLRDWERGCKAGWGKSYISGLSSVMSKRWWSWSSSARALSEDINCQMRDDRDGEVVGSKTRLRSMVSLSLGVGGDLSPSAA